MKSLFFRLFAAFISTILIALTIFAILMGSHVSSERINQLHEELLMQTRQISSMMTFREKIARRIPYPWLDSIILNQISEINSKYDSETWLVDMNGYVFTLGDTNITQERLKDLDLLNMVTQVLFGDEVQTQGIVQELEAEVATVGISWQDSEGSNVGAVLMHTSLAHFENGSSTVIRQTLFAAIAALFVGVILTYIISLHMVKPLESINKVVGEIGKGNFESRVIVNRNDEIGQLASSFNTMAEELNRNENMRRDFVANVSHELRSPMTSIQGYVQGIVDGVIPPSDTQRYLDVVLHETKRLNKLINELLDLSHIESGKFSLNFSRFNINELIRLTLIKNEKRFDDKHLDVEVLFRQENCFVWADQDRIEQVVTNLIDNAIKFSSDHGKLTIWTHSADDLTYVTVEDNGRGIAAVDLPLIFERFYTADKAHTAGGGTGLGLSIVKKLLEQHGQNIKVTSSGKGAAFTFSLQSAENQ